MGLDVFPIPIPPPTSLSTLTKYFEESILQVLLNDFMFKNHILSSCALAKLNILALLI